VKAMSCDAIRQFLLEAGWNAERRARAAEYLRHLKVAQACRAAMEDFDVLRHCACPRQPTRAGRGVGRDAAGELPSRYPSAARTGSATA